ncbi:MAG TPA: class I SAM-dependent methyltransferase [Bacteroidota bacterium]|nr:class I SAM-dependent methyltransferase [Bacteroidota bacterium]
MISEQISTLLDASKSVCILGLPGAGKSNLANIFHGYYTSRGSDPPSRIVGLVDALDITSANQEKLMDVYSFFIKQSHARLIFDGWPYEDEPENATRWCDVVFLLCEPPWRHLARSRSRGLRVPDTSEYWHHYREVFPSWLKKYGQGKNPLRMIESRNGLLGVITDYRQWLKDNRDPEKADEDQLLARLRPLEYQEFTLPFGGRIEGSHASEDVVRQSMRFLPHPNELRRVVDVGCEFGVASFILSEWGCREVIGIDTDPRCIDNARQLAKLFSSSASFYEMKGEHFNYQDIDLAVCLSVSHHLPSPQYLYSRLFQAKRVLIELPAHKFSIAEEASQYYDRPCVASWPSAKRDREVRLYARPDAIRYRDEEPGGSQMVRYAWSGDLLPAGEGAFIKKYVPEADAAGGGEDSHEGIITHNQFARLAFDSPSDIDAIDCKVEYHTDGINPLAWIQVNWHYQNGEVDQRGEGVRLPRNGDFGFTRAKPWNYLRKKTSMVEIVIRPDPGEEHEIKLRHVSLVAKLFPLLLIVSSSALAVLQQIG